MTDAIEIALDIRDKISELPETKEYLRLKQIIENDKDIQLKKMEIAKLQNEGKKEEANKLLNELNEMPIMVNFRAIKEQLADTLKIISNIIK